MTLTLLTSIITIAIGLIYTISTFRLPVAVIGRAMEPKIFPAVLGLSLIILGFCLMLQEIIKNSKNKQNVKKLKIVIGINEKKIALTLLNGILYAILFPIIGYVFSTFIFLEIQLYLFGGVKGWKVSTLVAIIFSIIVFVIFNNLLGVYLPKSPLGFI